jgi:hypothetical protein
MNFARRRLVRREPGEDKWNALAFAHGEFGHRFQIFTVSFDRGVENQGIGTSHRLQPAVAPAHPRHDRPVIEPNDQLHPDRHLPRQPLDDPHDIGIRPARRHEIDIAHCAFAGVKVGFEDQRVAAISALALRDFSLRSERPGAVIFSA